MALLCSASCALYRGVMLPRLAASNSGLQTSSFQVIFKKKNSIIFRAC
jgi:hypothetical protein